MKKFLSSTALLLFTLLFLFSCSMLKDDKPVSQATVEDSKLNRKTELVKDEKRETMKDESVETLPSPKTDDKIKDIIKLKERKRIEMLEQQEPFYVKLLGAEGKEELPVTLNLDAAPIANVIRVFSNFLKFDYLIDPQVTGSVTIIVNNSKMSKKEVWEMFEQILWLSGSYCSPDGDILHILPFAKMPQERKLLADHDPRTNVEVILMSIRNAASKDILEKIKLFITPGATAMDIAHQNSILLIESPANVAKIRALVKLLDQKNKNNWPQAVIQCINVSASRVKSELAATLPVLGFPVSTENIQAEPGSINLASLDRLQVIIATAANEEALDELKKWVAILDRTDVGEQEQVFIYKIVNSRSDQLLSAISIIFPTESTSIAANDGGGSTASSSTSTSGTGSKSAGSSSLAGPSKSSSSASAAKPSTSTATSSSSGKGQDDKGPASVFDVPVKVFADGVHNRLVIRTTPRTYAMLRAVLERLDTVAAQVLLQVLVSEVTLTDDTAYGLEFSAKRGNGANESLFGTNWTALGKDKNTDGFKYLLTDKNNPDQKFAYIKAIAGKGKVKVLSSPQILVASHSQAKISVGDRVPILTNTITDTSSVTKDNTAVNSTIEYVDTGIILIITPHVTEGGLITMELDQTVSDAIKTTSSTIDSPTISERVLQTVLSIRDGGTVIVGGIIKEKSEENNQSVPFVSEINLLSKLFGSTTSKTVRTEMVVLITGRIVDEHSNLDEITARYKQALKAITDMEKQGIHEENAK
jgi:type II secretion system protein D